jgi:ribosomal protein L18
VSPRRASSESAAIAACAARSPGTAERPRLAVFRSNLASPRKLIDDQAGKTLASASWQG